MAGYKINLSVVLKHLDTNNMEVYQSFRHREVERKELDRLLGYVLPIWVSSIENSYDQYAMVFQFNKEVNQNWRELKDHPELQTKILAAIGPGKAARHSFHMRDASVRQTRLSDLLMLRYSDIRKDEIGLWCSINSEATLIELCGQHGVQEKERDAIITEYRNIVR